MKVKLRPDTHLAPVAGGVHFARGERTFLLAGPPQLFTLLDENIGLLSVGTDLEELVGASGTEDSRPVLLSILTTLVDQDVLLRLDTLRTAPPEPELAHRFRDVLAYLECGSAEPYELFARLRRTRVLVTGSGSAAAGASRSLRAYGVAAVDASRCIRSRSMKRAG